MSQGLEYVAYIAGAPAQVWAALTDGELTRRYFFGRRMEGQWRSGGRWQLRMEDGTVDSAGDVRECDPPRRLTIGWRVEWLEEYRALPESIVTFQLDDLGTVTRLILREQHPTPIPDRYLEGSRRGWPIILSGLKTLVETGRPLPEFDAI